jgi:asparagine synthase (glutamine-hydrolysing)
MHFDLTRYLPGDLLTKVDRASMAVSLEAREPFLDHKLAALAVALPLEWKLRQGQNKYVLRRLLDRHFPAGLFDRPKHGFSAPVGKWLRGPLRGILEEELAPRRVRELGLLDADAVQRALTQFLAGGVSTSAAGMWFLLQLQRWGGRWLRSGARRPADMAVTRLGDAAGTAATAAR